MTLLVERDPITRASSRARRGLRLLSGNGRKSSLQQVECL
jgi:hypothetical protein